MKKSLKYYLILAAINASIVISKRSVVKYIRIYVILIISIISIKIIC